MSLTFERFRIDMTGIQASSKREEEEEEEEDDGGDVVVGASVWPDAMTLSEDPKATSIRISLCDNSHVWNGCEWTKYSTMSATQSSGGGSEEDDDEGTGV